MPMALRPGHDGDARRDGAHRAGDIVGKADDARRLDAGRGLELVEGDDRPRAHIDDLAPDAEILEHAFERAGILLKHFRRQLDGAAVLLGLGEKRELGQLIVALLAPLPAGLRLLDGRVGAGPHAARCCGILIFVFFNLVLVFAPHRPFQRRSRLPRRKRAA